LQKVIGLRHVWRRFTITQEKYDSVDPSDDDSMLLRQEC